MDLTDIKEPVVLTKTFRNRRTGEVKTITKPVPVSRPQKKVIARGKGKKTAGKILIARLRPFKGAMIEGLNRHGIYTSGLPFKTVIALYYNEFCLTDPTKKAVNVSEFINNVAFKLDVNDEINGDITEARNETAFSEIATLIDHIIAVFKGSKEKFNYIKSHGLSPYQYLTDEELLQAKACKNVEHSLLMKSANDSYVKVNDFKFLIKVMIGFAFVYYLLKA